MPSSVPVPGGAPKRLCAAQIADAHGVRGLVKLRLFVEDPGLLDGTLYKEETGDDTFALTLKNATNKFWIAEVPGINDRDTALALRGTRLYIDRDTLPETNDGEFYYSDLIGLPAVDADGNDVGKIIDVANFGAGDLLEIKPKGGEAFYLPVSDQTVPDIKSDCVTVLIPEGLIE